MSRPSIKEQHLLHRPPLDQSRFFSLPFETRPLSVIPLPFSSLGFPTRESSSRMADTNVDNQSQQQAQAVSACSPRGEKEELKYLGIVQLIAIQTLICFSRLYAFAKENSGPLKSGVQSVEGAVKTIVGPIYDKFHGIPYEILKFVDHKVDGSFSKLDYYVPGLVRHAYSVAQHAPTLVRSISDDVQTNGIMNTTSRLAMATITRVESTANDLYCKYEPVLEQYSVSAWHALNKMPVFPQVVLIVVPTAAYWSEKYNDAVNYGREKDYVIATYLPLVPTERITKGFSPPAANNCSGGKEIAVSQ